MDTDHPRGLSHMAHHHVEDLVLDSDGYQLVDIEVAEDVLVLRLARSVVGEAFDRSAAFPPHGDFIPEWWAILKR
jgi:hypothetical protein